MARSEAVLAVVKRQREGEREDCRLEDEHAGAEPADHPEDDDLVADVGLELGGEVFSEGKGEGHDDALEDGHEHRSR